ncbi:hypothetical protein GBA65_02630 [Rubrobacter marinus]|uniref:Transglutaminase-like domain-containing protein n=1 Tax=Rubrobacter marinus TaxID=2653852 RepID=A0A6G8PSW0_9ACTN|nr:DUF3488 and transglutaminase-like domain-containing protein [Rubrobacter marinus]QIN77588.1 hypothetical protein GBA65_02630 [Rubrobacter marinus]
MLVIAVAAHTYRGSGARSRGGPEGREAAFAAELRRLEVAGPRSGSCAARAAYGTSRAPRRGRVGRQERGGVGMDGWAVRAPLYVAGLAAGTAFSVLFASGATAYVLGRRSSRCSSGRRGRGGSCCCRRRRRSTRCSPCTGRRPELRGWERLVGQIGLDVWNAMGIMYANPIPYDPHPGLFVIVLPIVVLLVSFATSATLYEGSPVISMAVFGLTIGVLSTVSFEAGAGPFFAVFLPAAIALLLVTAGEGTALPSPGAVVAGLLVTGVVLSLPAMPFAEAAIRPATMDWTRIGTGGTSRLAVEADVGDYLTDGRDAELLRVDSPEPLLWRGGTLDFFDGVRWSSTTEPGVDYGEEVADGIATRTVVQSVEVLQAETDLLFGGYRMTDVSVPGAQQSTDASWSTRRPLTQGFSYRVLSQIPQPTAAQLEGAGTSYPAEVREKFLQLPEGRPAVLTETAATIERDYGLADATPYEKARAIERYLIYDGGFTYNLDVDYNRADQAIEEFLGEGREGFCTQFATSMALLARELDVPSRVVYGATTGREDDENEYVVTGYNMHTWVEVYFPGVGWYPFEPTPGSEIPSAMQANAPRPELPTARDEAVPQSPDERRQQLQEQRSPTESAPSDNGSSAGESPAWAYAVYALALVLLVAAVPLAKRLLAARSTPEGLYRDLAGRLRDALPPGRASLADSPALTPTERLLLLTGVVGVAVGPFREFARAYSESLYAQDPRSDAARAYRKALREYRSLPLWRRFLAALNPSSLLLRARQEIVAGKKWLGKRAGRRSKPGGTRKDG